MSDKKQLDSLLQGYVDGGLPGCALVVARKGEILYEGYFGYSDMEKCNPITKDSVFRQASMSKLPLYTVLMMLYDQGKFMMSDPLYYYLPEWEHMKKYVTYANGDVSVVPTNRPITIKDIATMKCGLPYCNFKGETDNRTLKSMMKCMEPLWKRGHYTLREHVKAMSQAILAAEPGEQWIYGFSSELVAAFIEVICGKSIDDVFQELLFDPLEMKDTKSHFFGDIEERLVTLYHWKEKDCYEKSNLFDDKFIPGTEHEAGWSRLFSTALDYTKLMQMLANGGNYGGKRLMGRKTIDLMRTNCLGPNGTEIFADDYNAGYGYGYGVRTLVDRQKANHNGSLGSFGWTGGFGSWCEADPEEGVSIVYMHNLLPSKEYEYHIRMRNAAYGLID